MINVQLLEETSGNLIKAFVATSQATYRTKGIDMSRLGDNAGLLIVCTTGSVSGISRQVSVDNTNFYTPYDNVGADISPVYGLVANSRYVSLTANNSSGIVAPYVRFQFITTGVVAHNISMYYIQDEK